METHDEECLFLVSLQCVVYQVQTGCEYYYSNDSVSTYLKYLPISNIKQTPLLKVMGLDRLNSRQKAVSDGYLTLWTAIQWMPPTDVSIFPTVEPFGSSLVSRITDQKLAAEYAYNELYEQTQVEAKGVCREEQIPAQG